jgi:hypothetical protein
MAYLPKKSFLLQMVRSGHNPKNTPMAGKTKKRTDDDEPKKRMDDDEEDIAADPLKDAEEIETEEEDEWADGLADEEDEY